LADWEDVMELGLAGKTAIITGGSAGIGLACARALYEEGVSVAIIARDGHRLELAAESIRVRPSLAAPEVWPLQGDLNRPESIQRLVAEAERRLARIFELPDETFLAAWQLKLLGYIRMIRAVAPAMIARRDGRIVNIVGGAGRTPRPNFLAGSTANAAILNLTRGLSKELAQHNVRLNAISPGATATERNERLAEQQAVASGRSVAEVRAETLRAIPLGRLVDPAEIAALTVLLVSNRLPSLTGGEIIIDGGQTPGV
jgi:3-oxoacyl-[acyl-carrier protein] reductase/bacilysin biosynthesis oxidoreductase BacG